MATQFGFEGLSGHSSSHIAPSASSQGGQFELSSQLSTRGSLHGMDWNRGAGDGAQNLAGAAFDDGQYRIQGDANGARMQPMTWGQSANRM